MQQITIPRRRAIPAWFGSVGLHVVLLLVLLALLSWAPDRKQPPGDRTAEVGIVLRHELGDDQVVYESASDTGAGSDSAAAGGTSSAEQPSLAELMNVGPPNIDTTSLLPSLDPVIGPGTLDSAAGQQHAGGAIGGLGGSGIGTFDGSKATVPFCGVEGEGTRFTFVIDRSASMGDDGQAALRLAKRELKSSLDKMKDLSPTLQFYVMFFNEETTLINPAGSGRIPYVNQQNINVATRRIDGIIPRGGTNHENALLKALATKPDVIFYLTDGGYPALSASEMQHVTRQAASCSINTIEFGNGPKPPMSNFLQQLAKKNAGQYFYVDVSGLVR